MLTKKDVRHVAELARVELVNKEEEKMAEELGLILSYIDKLNEVATGKIEASINPHHSSVNVSRNDDKASHGPAENTEKLLTQAPSVKDGFVKVKRVLGKRQAPIYK